ncbi:MAG: sodium:solute symporter family transporter, partial [Planctomycetaceae bacterium]
MWLLANSQGGLTSLDLGVIVVYLALTLGMGVWIARRQKSTEDYFLGGRNLPSWAVGLSLIASLLSTITYLGMPGEMFRSGVAFLTRQLGLPLVLLVVWFLWIPFFMRLRLTSAYEYLERRYNYAVRALAAVFCLLLLFGWISVVVLTASMAMAEISRLDIAGLLGGAASSETVVAETAAPVVRDVDMYAIIAGMGLITVLYTTLGGITADVWTDVVQFFVLLGGAFVTMAVVAWTTDSGLMDWLATSREYRHEEVKWFSWDIRDRSTVFAISIGMFFWHTCTHGAN